MGKAKRWFRGLLGMKKDKENIDDNSNYGERRDKKRWSFAVSGKDAGGLTQIPNNTPAADSAWLRSYMGETEDDQNNHAIAVAAATAAAADAAVAAAQAAAEVARLTSHGKGGRENQAAVKIQTVFRGLLARKALRALKGLVKLQALIRGYLVRKRAAATFHSMQALFRAQAVIRSQRARRSISSEHRNHQETRLRKPHEHFDEFHSKRLSHSASYDPSLNASDESPKIVEVDTCGPESRYRRNDSNISDHGDDRYHQAPSSPVRCHGPARLSIPYCRHLQDYDWGFVTEDYKFPTAQNTPRLGRANPPTTPSKSVCGDRFFRPYANCPSYMENTQSFRAKSRSYSAPKQRPESGPKKRLSLNEIMASRTSFSGVIMQRTVSQDFKF